MKKLIALIGLLGFTTSAHALINEEAAYPLALCQNEATIATVYTMPNQKEAQLVVHSATEIAAAPMNIIVHPVVLPDAQIFMNTNASLRIVSVDGEIKGVLNLQRHNPGITQVLNCQTFVHIQPEQPALM